MPSSSVRSPFIISTPSDQGSWYNQKKAALSTINSHIARNKTSRKQGSTADAGKSWRIDKKHNLIVYTPAPARALRGTSGAEPTEPVRSSGPDGLSLGTLQQLFPELDTEIDSPPCVPRNQAWPRHEPCDPVLAIRAASLTGSDVRSLNRYEAKLATRSRTFEPKGYHTRAASLIDVASPRHLDMPPTKRAISHRSSKVPTQIDSGLPFLPSDISAREKKALTFRESPSMMHSRPLIVCKSTGRGAV
jgi:hypothetical protein